MTGIDALSLSTTRLSTPAAEDTQLVQSCLQGDSQGFRTLFQRHRQSAFQVAMGVLRHREDALDACQDGFLKAFRSLGKYDTRRPFSPWLLRIVRNSAIDLLRRRQRRSEERLGTHAKEQPDPQFTGNPEEKMRGMELSQRLRWALDGLNPEQREVFLLREGQSLTYEEIAHVLGVAKGTVMSRLFYARRKLRLMLEDWL